jgi:four helix bundle protein
MADYRKLEVYELACVFSDRVIQIANRLPGRMADKADQLRRAADSIHEAISEGCGLGSDRQLLKYLRISLGSANECENGLHTLNRRGLLQQEEMELLDIARRLCAMIAKFIMRVEADIARAEGKGGTIRRPRSSREQSEPRAES